MFTIDKILKKLDEEQEYYYSKNAVKQRGWTDGMIREFLGEADITRRHMMCDGTGFYEWKRSYFFLSSRVDAVQRTKAFRIRQQQKQPFRWRYPMAKKMVKTVYGLFTRDSIRGVDDEFSAKSALDKATVEHRS